MHLLSLVQLFFIGPFEVSFVQTLYTVTEGDGPVEVCVNLTHPGIDVDILDETVRVNVMNDADSIYIPTGATLASETHFNF